MSLRNPVVEVCKDPPSITLGPDWAPVGRLLSVWDWSKGGSVQFYPFCSYFN